MLDREKIKAVFPFAAEIVRWFRRRKNELSSLPRHMKRRAAQKNNAQLNHGIIKVVFICQYIPAWSKNKQLYETLKYDDRFETMLLCIPNRVSANQLQNPEDISNDTYEYFHERGYEDAVNALIGTDKWLDLRSWHPDYVLYNRYDRPMPIPYTSKEVSSYAKVCLIIYGCALLRTEESMFDKQFAANTFCFFAESEGIKKQFQRSNRVLCFLKVSKAVCCGIAAVENAIKAKEDPCPAWSFSKNSFRILYTPRWTTDPTWGGSSFMKYKDTFLGIADENPDADILVRPHPLMFDNFVRCGILTEEEVEAYHCECLERENIRVDAEKEYLATFWNSSVLVCDYSSMIIEYFATKKPIIYLTYNKAIDYTDQMRAMLSACYIVNDESELKRIIEELMQGNDLLASRREEICREEITCGDTVQSSVNMRDVLIQAYTE